MVLPALPDTASASWTAALAVASISSRVKGALEIVVCGSTRGPDAIVIVVPEEIVGALD